VNKPQGVAGTGNEYRPVDRLRVDVAARHHFDDVEAAVGRTHAEHIVDVEQDHWQGFGMSHFWVEILW